MARDRKPKRYGRLSRTGHTSHGSQAQPPQQEPPGDEGGHWPTREYPVAPPPERYAAPPSPDDYPTQQHRRSPADEYPTQQHPRRSVDDFGPTEHYPGAPPPPVDDERTEQFRAVDRDDPRAHDDYPTQVHSRRPAERAYDEPRYTDPRYGYDEPPYDYDRPRNPAPDPSGYVRHEPERGYPDRGDHRSRDYPGRDDYRDRDDYREHGGQGRYGDDSRRAPDDRGYGPGDPGVSGPQGATTAGGAAIVLGKSALSGTNKAARLVTNKVIAASKSGGAEESGLTSLIWNQVLSYGTDAMITVSLAGTVFFGASAHAQRGNVLLYLLVTMAPFAVIAPIIGPALDRLQHGRRWTMAFTGIGRAILALVMAAHSTDLLVLYPCALGSLVLSKAYGVVRAAAAPRLVPRGMTLTEANARLTIFGLGSTLVLGAIVGALIKITGSYGAGLVFTAIGFAACAFFAFKLPKQVDSAQAAPRHPEEPARPSTQRKVPPLTRLSSWARRGFDPHVVIALQGESALRLLSGMLTIYLAFYVESTARGLTGVIQLGLVVGAVGVGNFLGTAIGTRLPMERPELIVVISVCVAGVVCFLVALAFSPVVAAVGMLIGSVGNALCKIALDALIQRDVVETLRSSAFGKSETFLQLAWVIGAALGVVLPSRHGDGPIGFFVAGSIMVAVGIVIFLRRRAMTSATAGRNWAAQPDANGSVAPRSID